MRAIDDLENWSNQRSIAVSVMKVVDKPSHAKSVEVAERVAEKILPGMEISKGH